MESYVNLVCKDYCKVKVTSVLDNNAKQFGGSFLMDGKDETCWCSGQGKSQAIVIEFKQPVKEISEIEIMVQGGFAPKSIDLYYYTEDPTINKEAEMKQLEVIEVNDTSEPQSFKINKLVDEGIFAVKFYMTKFTDFFGRVSFYTLKINGKLK